MAAAARWAARADGWAALAGGLLLCTLAAGPAHAGVGEVPDRFEHLGATAALANGGIRDLVQDRQGFLWLASRGGLIRFDGVAGEEVRPLPAHAQPQGIEPSPLYQSIFMAHDGALWVGNVGQGLLRLDPVTFQSRSYRHDPRDPGSLAGDNVSFAMEDGAGMIWVLGGEGLDRLDPATGRFTHFRHDPDRPDSLAWNVLTRGAIDPSGILWVGTAGHGLDRLDPRSGHFTHLRHDPGQGDSLPDDLVESVSCDPDGTLWIATDGGLSHYDPHSGHFRNYLRNPDWPAGAVNDVVMQALGDADGRIWLSTWGGGLRRLDPVTGATQRFVHDPARPESLSSNHLGYLYRSAEGSLWIVTLNGLDRWEPGAVRFRRLPDAQGQFESGKSAVSGALVDRQDRVWIASQDLGVWVSAGGATPWRSLPVGTAQPDAITSSAATGLALDPSGDVWIATGSGLNRVDARSGHVQQFLAARGNRAQLSADAFSHVMVDHRGGVWLAAYGAGVEHLDPGRGQFELYHHEFQDANSLGSNNVNVTAEDSLGGIWVGGDALLARLDPASRRLHNFAQGADGLGSTLVNDLAALPGGDVAIATDGGLYLYRSRQARFEAFGRREGLPGKLVSTVLVDPQGVLWAGTESGLARIDPVARRVRVFDERDGLPGGVFRQHAGRVAPDGTLYMGTVNGIIAFRPGDFSADLSTPLALITGVRKAGANALDWGSQAALARVLTQGSLELEHRYNSFSVRFSAPGYRWPRKSRYAYRLDGLETRWTETDSEHRQADYANLPPGRYVFQVRASNSDGVWSQGTARLAVTVVPAWWERWPVLVAGVCLLAAMGYLLAWQRARTLHRRAAQLEAQVADRTRDLVAAKEQAELASRAKTVFLTNMSHELRTPLNVVLGYAQLLVRDATMPVFAIEAARSIRQAGDHLLQLINDILDLSRIEAGKLELSPEPIGLPGLIEDFEKAIRVKAQERGLVFRVITSPSLPEAVIVDGRCLRQILLNLVGNAIKFTQEGHVELHVLATAEGADFVRLRIEVRDTGIGIPADRQELIFHPFEQLDRTQEGTGLGLAISRRLVHLMGGELYVESTPGVGSRFYFSVSLPRAPVARATSMPRQAIAGYTGERRTILVVDDLSANRAVMTRLLESIGMEVLNAGSGEAAIATVEARRPDLVLMDMVMEGIGGIEATRQLLKLPGCAQLPVIVVSASLAEVDRRRALAAGARDFLAKPVVLDALVSALQETLGLEWVLREETVPQATAVEVAPAEAPGDEVLRELLALAELGDMRAVSLALQDVVAADPRHADFCAPLAKLAEDFETERLSMVLRHHLRTRAV